MSDPSAPPAGTPREAWITWTDEDDGPCVRRRDSPPVVVRGFASPEYAEKAAALLNTLYAALRLGDPDPEGLLAAAAGPPAATPTEIAAMLRRRGETKAEDGNLAAMAECEQCALAVEIFCAEKRWVSGPAATPGQREAATKAAFGALVASGLHITPFNLDAIAEKCADAVLAAAPPREPGREYTDVELQVEFRDAIDPSYTADTEVEMGAIDRAALRHIYNLGRAAPPA